MDIKKLMDEYFVWLRSEMTFDEIGEYYEITVPYLDNANDYIQLYVKQVDNEIFFTDDSATLQKLKMQGFTLTAARKAYLQSVLLQYGVNLEGDELVAKVPVTGFAQKEHLFIQAMLKIEDICSFSKKKVASLFLDDVQDFFDKAEIFYTDKVQFIGKSGFYHNYDFLLQRSKTKPERLCRAVNNPNREAMSTVLFAWNDTKPARKADSQLIVILNDKNTIASGVEDWFANYGVKAVRFTQIQEKKNLQLLTAV